MTAKYNKAICNHAIALKLKPWQRVTIDEFTEMFKMNRDAGHQRLLRMFSEKNIDKEKIDNVVYYFATKAHHNKWKSKPLRKDRPRSARRYQTAEQAHEAKMAKYPDFNHVLHARFI